MQNSTSNTNLRPLRTILCLTLAATLVINPTLAPAATYYPAEQNMLLGQPAMMDGVTCIKKYGAPFCSCVSLEGGGEGCFYRRPSIGPYADQAACENVWGTGQCSCTGGACYQRENSNDATATVQCEGTVFIFAGKKEECREAGIDNAWFNCCDYHSQASESCSFQNIAKKMGWDDAAIMLAQTVGGYFAKDYAIKELAAYAATQFVSTGTLPFWASGANSLFGNLSQEVFSDIVFNSVSILGPEAGAAAATNAIAAEMVAVISTGLFWIGLAYTIYQMFNMIQAMQECKPGEEITMCKVGKKSCVFTGHTCTTKIFGQCLQKKETHCCFDSVLARIIQEQGRAQLGIPWGKGNCRGFTIEEFAQIDFSRIDFTEYVDEITRQMLNDADIVNKTQSIVDKYKQGVQDKVQ